jgi:two-component system, cell cycle sensor histidine kinase and response regulator CckA
MAPICNERRFAYASFAAVRDFRILSEIGGTFVADKPAPEELEQKIKLLEKELLEYKRAEKAYRLMVESTADSLYMVDKDCRYLFINHRHLTSRINLSEDEVIGRRYGDFHTPEEAKVFVEKVDEVFTSGASVQHAHQSSRDGRHFLRTFSPVKSPEAPDCITAVLIVSKDITDIKRIEDSLAKSRELYRKFVNTSRRMIFIKDHQFRYVLANSVLLSTFGRQEEEVLGKTDFDFMSREMAEKLLPAYKKALDSNGPVELEETIEKRDYQIRVFPMELSEKLTGISGRIEDVTEEKKSDMEKKKLEAKFLQAQKMEAIGTLAGGIAHDFNNLLMGIQGYATLMLLGMGMEHPFYEKLRGIERQVKNGADLTKQLLGFARVGRYEVKSTNLNEILSRTADLFGRTKKEIAISENYQPNLWTVDVDRGQMEQVLFNLYVNAWQAMPEGGSLYLETQNVELDEKYVQHYFVKQGRYVKMMVVDTGIGMDAQTRARLFEPFFTTKEMGRGTGLGLATVYGIVKAHGGFINVYSEKGQGTAFKIYLPASDKKVLKEDIAPQALLGGSETILVVDDEETIVNVTKEILESLGYRVFTAASGMEAIDTYRGKKEEISLVILDMVMPEMSGGETFDRIKEINPEVKVILSSGYSLNGQASSIMERGCRSFIQKPFNSKELSSIIREVLAGKKN